MGRCSHHEWLSCHFLCGLSIRRYAEAVQSALSSSSGGIAPYVGTDLLCTREEVSLTFLDAAILGPPIVILFLVKCSTAETSKASRVVKIQYRAWML